MQVGWALDGARRGSHDEGMKGSAFRAINPNPLSQLSVSCRVLLIVRVSKKSSVGHLGPVLGLH